MAAGRCSGASVATSYGNSAPNDSMATVMGFGRCMRGGIIMVCPHAEGAKNSMPHA
jgi:hypothetical protein